MLPVDDEALQSDVYLELLLDSHRRAPRLAFPSTSDSLDPDLRRSAQLLDRSLIRFHPSFRFEEALAARLRAAADALGSPRIARGRTVPFPGRATVPLDRLPLDRGQLSADDREALSRVLVGGAIASGVSIAGAAAWLAWRRRSRQETVA